MSMLLDQALVEDVAKYCPAQFLEYHKCLSGGDASKCIDQQTVLSKCVREEVPSFIKIIKECEGVMKAYEDCVRDNLKFRSKCFDLLQEVRQCSSKAINIPEQ